MSNEDIRDLPMCKCELPCDVKSDEEKQFLYFRCAKKNTWHKMRDIFDIDDEPCNFFMKYTQDDDYKREINDKYQEINSLTRRSHWLTNLTDGFYE